MCKLLHVALTQTTFEEYQVQRYEGASTLYGPHTLAAYLQLYRQLATAMASGEEVPEGPAPPDLSEKIPSFVAPVVTDSIPKGAHYGGIVMDVRQRVFRAGDVVSATFHSVSTLSCDNWVFHSVHIDRMLM